jgi:hypothetical protein
MSATYNLAVKQEWDRTAGASREQLKMQLRDGLGLNADLDDLVRQMAERNVGITLNQSGKMAGKKLGSKSGLSRTKAVVLKK